MYAGPSGSWDEPSNTDVFLGTQGGRNKLAAPALLLSNGCLVLHSGCAVLHEAAAEPQRCFIRSLDLEA